MKFEPWTHPSLLLGRVHRANANTHTTMIRRTPEARLEVKDRRNHRACTKIRRVGLNGRRIETFVVGRDLDRAGTESAQSNEL